MEKLKMWFQKARKPFDNWMFYRQIDKLTDAIYKYAFKDSSSHYTREDALNVAKAIIWDDKEIRKIISD